MNTAELTGLPRACLARFRPERVLGSGGFATVFLANQVQLSRPVAIKVLHRDHLRDPEQVERFLQEARITAALSDAHIVRVIDHGVDEGIPWIAYEYVPGQSLRGVLETTGKMPVGEAVEAAAQVAGALSTAHAAGVLHRDIKPENILCAERGVVKVTDFGIARWTASGRARTQTGMLLGTPAYFAPEQIVDGAASPASDIYALGITLFELISGRPPFVAEKLHAVLEHHVKTAPPRLADVLVESVPQSVERIVARALAKLPAERFESAAEMRDALVRALDAGTAPPVGSPRPTAARLKRNTLPVPLVARPADTVITAADPRARRTEPIGPGDTAVRRTPRRKAWLICGAVAMLGAGSFVAHQRSGGTRSGSADPGNALSGSGPSASATSGSTASGITASGNATNASTVAGTVRSAPAAPVSPSTSTPSNLASPAGAGGGSDRALTPADRDDLLALVKSVGGMNDELTALLRQRDKDEDILGIDGFEGNTAAHEFNELQTSRVRRREWVRTDARAQPLRVRAGKASRLSDHVTMVIAHPAIDPGLQAALADGAGELLDLLWDLSLGDELVRLRAAMMTRQSSDAPSWISCWLEARSCLVDHQAGRSSDAAPLRIAERQAQRALDLLEKRLQDAPAGAGASHARLLVHVALWEIRRALADRTGTNASEKACRALLVPWPGEDQKGIGARRRLRARRLLGEDAVRR